MLHQPFDIQIVYTAEYPLLNPFVLCEVLGVAIMRVNIIGGLVSILDLHFIYG